jgi:hypothetical protein
MAKRTLVSRWRWATWLCWANNLFRRQRSVQSGYDPRFTWGAVEGILWFRFPDLNQDALALGTKLILSFSDAFGKTYFTTVVLNPRHESQFGYLPGLNQAGNLTASPQATP